MLKTFPLAFVKAANVFVSCVALDYFLDFVVIRLITIILWMRQYVIMPDSVLQDICQTVSPVPKAIHGKVLLLVLKLELHVRLFRQLLDVKLLGLLNWVDKKDLEHLRGSRLDPCHFLLEVVHEMVLDVFSGECESSHVLQDHVDVLGSLFVENIVVKEYLTAGVSLDDLVGLHAIKSQPAESNSNLAFGQEVHLGHFLFFYHHDVLIRVRRTEKSRDQTQTTGINEVSVVIDMSLLVRWGDLKDALVCDNHILVEVVDDHVSSDRVWKLIYLIRSVCSHQHHPIISPVVLHVLPYFILDDRGQSRIESLELQEPLMEVLIQIWRSCLLPVSGHDVEERAHDVGEKGNSTHHDNYAVNHLVLAYWVEVSISNSREHRK